MAIISGNNFVFHSLSPFLHPFLPRTHSRQLLLLLLLSHFSQVWLCDPIDGSPPGSPVPGILQARTLEWAAISFSNAWKWKVKVKSVNDVRLLATPWTAAHQALTSMGFSRQEYWSGVCAFTTQELLLTKKMKSDLRSLGDQIAYFLELKHLTPISKLPHPSFRWCLQRGNKLAEYGFSPTDSAGTHV